VDFSGPLSNTPLRAKIALKPRTQVPFGFDPFNMQMDTGPMRSLSILVADDDTALLKVVKKVLETREHKVTAASSGTAAVCALETGKFDLVLTDVFFPGRDGIEVILERAKSDAQAPVIAMSGEGRFGTDHYLLLVKKLGADVILKKPFTPEQLFAAVEKALP
jgi:CheY-like chemotaxis protein